MPPNISAAMIVRDEAEWIGACLSGISAFADEICVLDTGSTDGTLEIAQRFGCKTGQFTWCDDFSAARNASVAMCSGTWVFILDADERLAPSDAVRFRGLANAKPEVCFRFITRNYTDAAGTAEFVPCLEGDAYARGFAGWYPSGKVRLFPNTPGARFEGRVHELINPALERAGMRILTSDIPIHHYPLLKSSEAVRRKQLNYIAMGQAKIRDHPDDHKAYAELGAQYAELGDAAQAAGAYREALRLHPLHAGYLRELGALLHLLGRGREARAALEASLRLDPGMAEGWKNLGVVLADAGDWEGALTSFREAVSRAPHLSEAHRHLAIALQNTGQLTLAVASAREAVRLHPRSEWARALYLEQMTALGLRQQAESFLSAASVSRGNPAAR